MPDGDEEKTRRQSRSRALHGPSVRLRELPRVPSLPTRKDGRPDLPVIGPDDTPRRVARRLV